VLRSHLSWSASPSTGNASPSAVRRRLQLACDGTDRDEDALEMALTCCTQEPLSGLVCPPSDWAYQFHGDRAGEYAWRTEFYRTLALRKWEVIAVKGSEAGPAVPPPLQEVFEEDGHHDEVGTGWIAVISCLSRWSLSAWFAFSCLVFLRTHCVALPPLSLSLSLSRARLVF
jgi:hypothetical protein